MVTIEWPGSDVSSRVLTINFPSGHLMMLKERSTLEGITTIASLFLSALQNTALAPPLSLIVKTSVAPAEVGSIAGIASVESAEKLAAASLFRRESKGVEN